MMKILIGFVFLISICSVPGTSWSKERTVPSYDKYYTAPKTSYVPTAEQRALIEELKKFAQTSFKSEMRVEFHDKESDPIRAGSLRFMQVTQPESYFYKPLVESASRTESAKSFLKSHKALFLIDDNTIDSLIDTTMSGTPTRLLQSFKGIPVYQAVIRVIFVNGIAQVHSLLVPTSKLDFSLSTVPQIKPDKIAKINLRKWLSEGVDSSMKIVREDPKKPNTFTVTIKRTVSVEGKKLTETETLSVVLVVYPLLNTTHLAWCIKGSGAIYDAMTGALLRGKEGLPAYSPTNVAGESSSCPFYINN